MPPIFASVPHRPAPRAALALQLVLMSALLVGATAITVTAGLLRILPGVGDTRAADLVPSILIGVVPLALAAALLAYLIALRVGESATAIASAARHLRLGHLEIPVPHAREVELTPLTEELARIRTYLQEEAREVREPALLPGVVHELRASLTILQNALELLAADPDGLATDEFVRVVGAARRSGTRLVHLMRNVATISAIRTGRLVVRPKPISLSVIIADALTTAADAGALPPDHLTCLLPGDSPVVIADRPLVGQALADLIIYTAHSSRHQPHIALRGAAGDDGMRITVEDLRADGDHAAAPGASLDVGLTLARAVVEAHGGRIGVERDGRTGARVWFTLPLAPPHPVHPQLIRPPLTAGPTSAIT